MARKASVLFVAVIAMLIGAATARAHHSVAAEFDTNKPIEFKGTIKKVDWTNPHIWIWVDVTESSGATETYGFEGMTPNFLSRRGWTRSSMQPGMKVSVTFRPMKDGKPGGMFVSGTLPDGKVLTMRGGETGQ